MKLTYLGHSAVMIETDSHRILIDPFLTHNPMASMTREQAIAAKPTHILLTHGHADHIGDTPEIVQALNIPVVGMVEVCGFLKRQHGLTTCEDANFGGEIDLGNGHTVALVPAWHSSSSGADGSVYTGNPAGLVVTVPGAVIYHAGDTSIFTDMQLIEELYQPTVGILPIGGRYTMDARAAALACRKYFDFDHIVPVHYGTFGILAASADAFVADNSDLPIHPLQPGESLSL